MRPLVNSLGVRIARCPLWMADYSHGEAPAEGSHPFTPLPWSTWAMWQTSGDKSSRVPGIVGAVDHDVFNGGEAELREMREKEAKRDLAPEEVVSMLKRVLKQTGRDARRLHQGRHERRTHRGQRGKIAHVRYGH